MVGSPTSGGTVRAVDDGQTTPARIDPSAKSGGAKAPLFRHPGRVAVFGGGLFLVAVLIAGAIGSSDTSNLLASQRQPKEIQGYSPQQGAIVPPNTPITVDLRDDLTADISVCGPNPENCTPIPLDQVQFVAGLGQIIFKPSEKTDLGQYPAGPVTVHVDYHLQGAPATDAGTFTWSFVAKA